LESLNLKAKTVMLFSLFSEWNSSVIKITLTYQMEHVER